MARNRNVDDRNGGYFEYDENLYLFIITMASLIPVALTTPLYTTTNDNLEWDYWGAKNSIDQATERNVLKYSDIGLCFGIALGVLGSCLKKKTEYKKLGDGLQVLGLAINGISNNSIQTIKRLRDINGISNIGIAASSIRMAVNADVPPYLSSPEKVIRNQSSLSVANSVESLIFGGANLISSAVLSKYIYNRRGDTGSPIELQLRQAQSQREQAELQLDLSIQARVAAEREVELAINREEKLVNEFRRTNTEANNTSITATATPARSVSPTIAVEDELSIEDLSSIAEVRTPRVSYPTIASMPSNSSIAEVRTPRANYPTIAIMPSNSAVDSLKQQASQSNNGVRRSGSFG